MSSRNFPHNITSARPPPYTYPAFTSTDKCNIISPSDKLIRSRYDDISLTPSQKYVKWGVSWKTPTYMILCALSGVVLAIGHHAYYQHLAGTVAGSSQRQQWASRIGTGFSFLIVALFKAACDESYSQLIWTLVKKRSYSLDAVDKLFALTRDPTGLVSWELMKGAKFAMLLALICWCMAIAGIAPPSTLSVVPATYTETRPTSWPAVDWGSEKFSDILFSILGTGSLSDSASSRFLEIASQTAQTMEVLPLPPPSTNSSYSQSFYGPTVQCSPANSTQQAYFDFFAASLGNDSAKLIATQPTFESGQLNSTFTSESLRGNPFMLFFSAFTPLTTVYNTLLQDGDSNNPGPALEFGAADKFNNWQAHIPGAFYQNSIWNAGPHGPGQETLFDEAVQQIFIQTSNQSLVCMMGNASFVIQMEYEKGVQKLVDTTVTDFKPLVVPIASEDLFDLNTGLAWNSTTSGSFIELNSYVAYFLALSSVLNGNVTTSVMDNLYQTVSDTMTLYDYTSSILQNGLSACDDFVHGYWDDNAVALEGPNNSTDRHIVSWNDAASSGWFNASNGSLETGPLPQITNNLFQKPSWMCRNRTLARAIEDLANNFTISMLSSAMLATPNATDILVDFVENHNVYEYDSRNLFLSYGFATLVTALALCLGFYSLHYNGVAHSNSFTAMLATTETPELHSMFRGHSLGALPLTKDTSHLRIKFGVLRNDWRGGKDDDIEVQNEEKEYREGHVGFGRVETVGNMVRGGLYT